MENKIPLFLDFDETLADSIPAFVQVYNERYQTNANHTQLKQYDFKDICPLLKENEVKDIFACDRFWEILKLKDGCFDVLNDKRNRDRFDYILVTIGNPKNLYKKMKYTVKNLPMIEQMISITNKNNTMNKELVNMDGGVFVDDHQDNLFSSNAKYKICFIEEWYPWNREYKGNMARNWNDVQALLDLVWKFENKI